MARFELADIDGATLAPVNASGEVFYELGMMYAAGRNVQPDLISAHKWFNLAAMRGNKGQPPQSRPGDGAELADLRDATRRLPHEDRRSACFDLRCSVTVCGELFSP